MQASAKPHQAASRKIDDVHADLYKKVLSVPEKPGVYVFKSAKERVLYVGKAKNLKNRLKIYFQRNSTLDYRKAAMMRNISDFTYIVTENELEALALEANLIKQYKPRFNIILRDDKNYPYLKLTVNEQWPSLEIVRKIRKDGALYFGPYVPSSSLRESLAFIRRNFRIRDCHYSWSKPIRPCIQYQMGRCPAPCAGNVSREEYMKFINEVKLFLSGKRKDLLEGLKKRMEKLSEEMRFEEAARIRDRIRALERAWESQKVVSPDIQDTDVIGFYRDGNEVSCKVFFIRNGLMIGSKDLSIKETEDVPDSELMRTFITQFYSKEIIPPSELILPALPEDSQSLKAWLSQRKGKKVRIHVPSSGKKKELVNMASENAYLSLKSSRESRTDEILNELRDRLQIRKNLKEIGAFDVSTISGNHAVGSFVCWAAGDFNKERYRRLKIKTVPSIDDYSMMEELIERIIGNLDGDLPDLVLIDGGKAHLETARKIFDRKKAFFKKLPALVAVAKDPDRAYITTSDKTIDLEDRSPSSLLLKKIRDEAHRFAIGYHRKLRQKKLMESPLEKIPGIGKKRRLELLRVFGSIENIKKASVEEIQKLKGFNRRTAENLLNELRRT